MLLPPFATHPAAGISAALATNISPSDCSKIISTGTRESEHERTIVCGFWPSTCGFSGLKGLSDDRSTNRALPRCSSASAFSAVSRAHDGAAHSAHSATSSERGNIQKMLHDKYDTPSERKSNSELSAVEAHT